MMREHAGAPLRLPRLPRLPRGSTRSLCHARQRSVTVARGCMPSPRHLPPTTFHLPLFSFLSSHSGCDNAQPFRTVGHFPHPSSCRAGGFALVLALSVMSLLLLVLLSMSALVEVEQRSSEQQRSKLAAEQQALLGLQIALGELQVQLGPDQRVSAPASILDAGGSYGQPDWVGVWADPDVLAARAVDDPNDNPFLLNWLVSGNASHPPSYVPDADLSGLPADQHVTLVADGVAPAARAVAAPLVDLDPADTTAGGYAYWVGDEGVKAHIASSPVDFADRVTDADPSLALLPQRSSIQNLDTKLSVWGGKDAPRARLLELGDLDIAAAASTEVTVSTDFAERFFHDLTAWSSGLLTDCLRGGLKLDLERVFEMNSSEFAQDFLPLVDNDDRMFPSTLPVSLTGMLSYTGPRWDVLHRYPQQTRHAVDSFPLTRTTETSWETGREFQLGVAPVLAHFQCYSYVSLVDVTTTVTGSESDGDSASGSYSYQPRIYYQPTLVLWNPYDVAIEAPEIRLQWFLTSTANVQFSYTAGRRSATDPAEMETMGSGDFPVFMWYDPDGKARLNLRTPPHRFEPGKAYIFSLEKHEPYALGALGSGRSYDLVLGQNTYGLYQDAGSSFESEQDLEAMESDQEFDYELRIARRSPHPATDQTVLNLEKHLGGSGDGNFFSGARFEFAGFAADGNALEQGAYPMRADSGALERPTAEHYLFGVEVSLILPELHLDDYIPTRARGRLLSNFNLRTRRVDRLHFPGNFPGGFGQDPENRSYSSVFLCGTRNLGDIDQFAQMASPDSAGTEAYIGYSDRIDTLDRAIYFYLPRGEHPFYSVGDLRHIDLVESVDRVGAGEPYALTQQGEVRNHGPSHVVGNSYADAFIAPGALYQTDHTGRLYPDYSWLCNYQLWDRFFVSGIPGTGAFNRPLPFGGFQLADGAAPQDLTAAQLVRLRDFRTTASELTVAGAFNVNSTSVDAWSAFLGSFFDAPVDTVLDGAVPNTDRNPVLAAPIQAGSAYDAGSSLGSAAAAAHRGYRRLTVAEITALATAMVEQVRKRGPFTSLAQFVNRSLDPDDAVHTDDGSSLSSDKPTLAELAKDPRLMGALQAAIDTAGLNDDFTDWFIGREGSRDLEPQYQNKPPNVPAAMGPVLAGAPGYLNQGALLARLAPALSVRSDSFTIRAYGEARNSVSGAVESRALCEARVQRSYDYIDPADPPERFPPSATVNQYFGRRFKLVDFRWLEPVPN